jgi:hypothetical protein
VIITVTIVRMMEVPGHHVVDVIAMFDLLMATVQAMLVRVIMVFALVTVGAFVRIRCTYRDVPRHWDPPRRGPILASYVPDTVVPVPGTRKTQGVHSPGRE